MSVRMITVSAPDQTIPPIKRKAEELGATGIRTYAETQRDGRTTLQMLVGSAARQDVVDAQVNHGQHLLWFVHGPDVYFFAGVVQYWPALC